MKQIYFSFISKEKKEILDPFLDLEVSETLHLCQKQVNMKRQLKYLIALNKHPSHQRLLLTDVSLR